jgi:hypothetical protein
MISLSSDSAWVRGRRGVRPLGCSHSRGFLARAFLHAVFQPRLHHLQPRHFKRENLRRDGRELAVADVERVGGVVVVEGFGTAVGVAGDGFGAAGYLDLFTMTYGECARPSSFVIQLLNNGHASRIFGMPIVLAMSIPVVVFLKRFESFSSLLDGAVAG